MNVSMEEKVEVKVKNKMKAKVKQSESDKLNNMSVSVHRIEVNRVSESEN